MVFSELNLFL